MSGFPILDLVVGMIFIFFLLSVICSSAIEIVLSILRARAKILSEWAVQIFDKEITKLDGSRVRLGQSILDHCAVTALSKPGKAPSYVDAKNFIAALLDKITFDANHPNKIAKEIDEVITSLENTELLSTEIKRSLLTFANDVKKAPEVIQDKISALELFKQKAEGWYDSSMDRLTGALKRRYITGSTLILATILTVLMNADSLAIAKYLYSNPEARARLAAKSYAAAGDPAFLQRSATVDLSRTDSMRLDTLKKVLSLSLQNAREANAALAEEVPLGWKGFKWSEVNVINTLAKVTGLLTTILAIFMGAPFWFDMLNKLANLRSTGPKPPSSTNPGK